MPYTEIQYQNPHKPIQEPPPEPKVDVSQKQRILCMDWSESKQLLVLGLLNKKIIFYKIKDIFRGVLDIKEVKTEIGKLPFIPLKLNFKDQKSVLIIKGDVKGMIVNVDQHECGKII